MIAVDTNILVYAHRGDSEWHEAANEAVTQLANSGNAWAIPWSCVHEFLAIVTHPRIYDPPTPQKTAFEAIKMWQQSPDLRLLNEDLGYIEKLEKLCVNARLKGGRIHDARIAAICMNHGVSELWTADRDFGKFPELNTRNPLLA